MIRLAINGAAGRMGRQLLSAVALRQAEQGDVRVAGAIELAGTTAVGADVTLLSAELAQAAGQVSGVEKLLVVDDALSIADGFDVVIDFTRPESSIALLAKMVKAGKAIVIGTTGLDASQTALLQDAAESIPVLYAPNFSVGVTVTLKLLEMAASALGDTVDIEVIEAHHRNKVDAPSGTALRMGEVLAESLGRDLSTCAIYGREGNTGVRDKKTIGFETIRGGDIIGDHTVLFAGLGERIEISHKATDRMVFARGAVHAASWLAEQSPGLYNMTHVLGLNE